MWKCGLILYLSVHLHCVPCTPASSAVLKFLLHSQAERPIAPILPRPDVRACALPSGLCSRGLKEAGSYIYL